MIKLLVLALSIICQHQTSFASIPASIPGLPKSVASSSLRCYSKEKNGKPEMKFHDGSPLGSFYNESSGEYVVNQFCKDTEWRCSNSTFEQSHFVMSFIHGQTSCYIFIADLTNVVVGGPLSEVFTNILVDNIKQEKRNISDQIGNSALLNESLSLNNKIEEMNCLLREISHKIDAYANKRINASLNIIDQIVNAHRSNEDNFLNNKMDKIISLLEKISHEKAGGDWQSPLLIVISILVIIIVVILLCGCLYFGYKKFRNKSGSQKLDQKSESENKFNIRYRQNSVNSQSEMKLLKNNEAGKRNNDDFDGPALPAATHDDKDDLVPCSTSTSISIDEDGTAKEVVDSVL